MKICIKLDKLGRCNMGKAGVATGVQVLTFWDDSKVFENTGFL